MGQFIEVGIVRKNNLNTSLFTSTQRTQPRHNRDLDNSGKRERESPHKASKRGRIAWLIQSRVAEQFLCLNLCRQIKILDGNSDGE